MHSQCKKTKYNIYNGIKLNKDNGITLIALVITIIVLLILAGTSIAMLIGENGIISQAQKASEQTEIAEAKEQAKMDILAWQTEKLEKRRRCNTR